jgi:hypothetical protein
MDRSVSQPFPIYMWLSKGDCLGKWSVLVNNGAQKDVSAPSGPGLCAFVHLSGSILRKTPLFSQLFLRSSRACYGKWYGFRVHENLAWFQSEQGAKRSVLSLRTSRLRSQSLALPMHLRKTRLCFLKCLSYVCPEPVLVKSSFYM